MEKSVYHFKPKRMIGDTLVPLNTLKSKTPEAYREQVKKYEGREYLLEKTIPILNCLWNDVLHFSPIHPQVILNSWRENGWYEHVKPRESIEVIRAPVRLLKIESTICFQSNNYDFDNYDPSLDKYWMFASSEFFEQVSVEPEQIAAWRKDFTAGRRFLWFSHTKHILAKQELDTRKCEILVCH